MATKSKSIVKGKVFIFSFGLLCVQKLTYIIIYNYQPPYYRGTSGSKADDWQVVKLPLL